MPPPWICMNLERTYVSLGERPKARDAMRCLPERKPGGALRGLEAQ
jgi:hypothetical protein